MKKFGLSMLALGFLGFATMLSADTFTVSTFGTGTSGGAGFQMSTDGSSTYGGVAIDPTGTFTLGDLTQFSFSYDMLQGNYAAGTPRIYLCTDASCTTQGAFVYAFTGVVQGNTGNTGNIVTSTASDVNTNGKGFGSCQINYPEETFSQFVSCAGASTPIGEFGIVVDSSSLHAQTLSVSDINVNGQKLSAVPEPASFALLGAGLLGVALLRRRKHNQNVI